MNSAFSAKATDASHGLLSCLRSNLLEVGALCAAAGITSAHIVNPPDVIFSALEEIWKEGGRYDFISVCQRMRRSGGMERFADTRQILDVLHTPTFPGAAADHIRDLLECAAARRLHALGSRLTSQAFDATTDVAELVDSVRAEMAEINAAPVVAQTSLAHFTASVLAGLEKERIEDTGDAIAFGLGLDADAGPFCRGDLVVIAGETKRGKSAIAGNIVENVAKAGKRCAVFSFEMTGQQNAERVLASQCGINMRDLRNRIKASRGQLMADPTIAEASTKLRRIHEAICAWKVEIFERSSTIDQIVAEMIRMKCTGGLDLTVVDYAQLVTGHRRQGDSREREVASISGALKNAAVKTQSVVILLSQLNENGKLRESRALGQDANCVLFLEGDDDNRIVRVGAARSAPTGTEIPVHWSAEHTRFSEK